jgi:D-alanyl-D-alanine carboxypeptidase (penicillin-binding protein 5/6)
MRYRRAAELLDVGFAGYERVDLVKQGERLNVTVRVANGVTAQLTPVAGRAVSLLRRRDEERDLQVRYQVPTMIAAPVKRHQVIGELIVEEHGALVAVVPVVSPKHVAASSVLSAALR